MTKGDLSQAIGAALPYLRRYARALTGSQTTGDNYAAATLEAILTDRSAASDASSPKVGLFKVFHGIWVSTGAPVVGCAPLVLDDSGPRADASFDRTYDPDRVLEEFPIPFR